MILFFNACDQDYKTGVGFYQETNNQLITLALVDIVKDSKKVQMPSGDSVFMKKAIFTLTNKSMDTLFFKVIQNDSNEISPATFASKDKNGWEILVRDLERTKQLSLYPNTMRTVHFYLLPTVDSVKVGLGFKSRYNRVEVINFFDVSNQGR